MINSLKERETRKKGKRKDIIILGITITLSIILLIIFPDRQKPVIMVSQNFFIQMIIILPAVMILLGLFSVFVPKEIIIKYLGKEAGIKAIFIGIFIGSLPTGPLYIAFPMASALLHKGAKISAIIAFLSAWACIKIPQEMVELQFLGFKFMAVRLTLTIIFVVIMGITIEQIINRGEKKQTNLIR